MKKIYSFAVATLFSTGIAAALPTPQHAEWTRHSAQRHSNTRGTVLKAPEAQVVIDEDFSLFTAGTEDAPDAINIAAQNPIPDSYTKTPGWRGNGVYQAGGICMLGEYVNSYDQKSFGSITSPKMALFGTVKITFRARAIAGNETNLWLAFCDSYNGPVDDIDCPLTTEWKQFAFTSTKGSFDSPCNFQFKAENGTLLLDDIKIERTIDRIPAPESLPAINNSLTEFVANWEPTDAPEHLLNVYYQVVPTNPKTETVTENFDGIRLKADGKSIDTANPNYPAGWTIDVSTKGATDMRTDEGWYNSAPQAIVLDEVDDYILTAPTNLPIKSVKFWIRPTKYDEDNNSLLAVRLFGNNGTKVDHIANLPNYWLEEDGGWKEFSGEQIGLGYNQIELRYESKDGDMGFVIDDIQIECEEQPVNKFVIENLPVEGESYTVSDIDPEKDYYYYLQARDGEIVSDTSYPVWVDGLNGLKVKTLQPTETSATSFTANWERMPHADSYVVSACRIVKATEPINDVTVITENFDKITEGTVETPGTFYANLNLAENGMANSAWILTNPAWAEGMAGTNGTTWYGAAGLVASPRMSLKNNGGTFTVEANVYATVNTIPELSNAQEVILVMILNDITDQQASAALEIPCPNVGLNHGKVTFKGDGRDNIIIAFMSKSGKRFFVDDVTITQNLLAGESLVSPAFASAVTDKTSHTFTGLTEGEGHGYTVVAKRTKAYEDYATNTSDMMTVEAVPAGIENVIVDNDSTFTVYNLQGIRVLTTTDKTVLSTLPRGIYIINGKKTLINN